MKSLAVVVLCLLPVTGIAEELEGDELYRVTTLRAAPAQLAALLDWFADVEGSGYYADAAMPPPLLMRHSQGDQWDLMLIAPMGSWVAYHADEAAGKRGSAAQRHADLLAAYGSLIAFEEDHFAYGPAWKSLSRAYADNAFYHIEMFEAVAGKTGELLDQRRRENGYLEATGQRPNTIFRRAAGSDVDVFTIGFHPSFEAFAAPAPASVEEKEAAAKAAGFAGLADLSFFLRSLISGHHDTLAVKVE